MPMKLRPRLTIFSLLALAFCLSALPALLGQVAAPALARPDHGWPDRRPIGQFDWVGDKPSPQNPAGWWMAKDLDARDPNYAAAFRKAAEPAWLAALDNAV